MTEAHKSVILFGGSDERNGDYSLIRECCQSGASVHGWSCMKDLRKSDQVFAYVLKPIRAIVAVGEALSDAKQGKNYRYESRIGNLHWITPHITLTELASEFPEWGWATKGLGKCTIPHAYVERINTLAKDRTESAAQEVQTHILLSGMSARDDLTVAVEKRGVSKRWVCPKNTVAGDRILVYYREPTDAIVATATAVRDARRHPDGRFKTDLRDIRWLTSPITLREMRIAFSDWKWTKNCSASVTLPPIQAAVLWNLAEDDRKEEQDTTRNAAENGGSGFGSPESNRLVEVSAVNFVTAYLTTSGYTVRSREQEKIGYDLDAFREDEELHIEVKGTQCAIPGYILTQNERARAESDPRFRLYVVTNATGESPKLHQYDTKMLERTFDLQPLSYRATLREFPSGDGSV